MFSPLLIQFKLNCHAPHFYKTLDPIWSFFRRAEPGYQTFGEVPPPPPPPWISDLEIGIMGIFQQLKLVRPDRATGRDKAPACVLNETANQIVLLITHLFQQIYSTSKLSSDWYKVLATLIFKKGDKSHPGKYQLILITYILCKPS